MNDGRGLLAHPRLGCEGLERPSLDGEIALESTEKCFRPIVFAMRHVLKARQGVPVATIGEQAGCGQRRALARPERAEKRRYDFRRALRESLVGSAQGQSPGAGEQGSKCSQQRWAA